MVAHSLRDALNKHKGSRLGLLKIDFKNAFNMVSRERALISFTRGFRHSRNTKGRVGHLAGHPIQTK